MKNALILHGTSDNPKKNWFKWLGGELEQRDWKVSIPLLPQADNPSIKRYNDFLIEKEKYKFNDESVLIGHSSGAVAILGLLQNLPENISVDRCYLVGAFKNDLGWESLESLFDEEFDFEKIKSKANKFIFIHSDNDPYCPLDHAEFLSEKLDGELIVKKGQKHFSISTAGKSYEKFPFLLQKIIDDQ